MYLCLLRTVFSGYTQGNYRRQFINNNLTPATTFIYKVTLIILKTVKFVVNRLEKLQNLALQNPRDKFANLSVYLLHKTSVW